MNKRIINFISSFIPNYRQISLVSYNNLININTFETLSHKPQMLKTPEKHNQPLSSTIRSVMKSSLSNLIGVKCAQCSLIYPQDQIEQHLITHIKPKYLMPHEDNSGAKKLSTSIQLTDQTLTVRSADIQSLNMQEFPRLQHIRKDIQAPSQFAIAAHNLPTLKKDIVSYRGDQRDLSSRLDGFVEKEQFEQMILTQTIYLGVQSINLGLESDQIRTKNISMMNRPMQIGPAYKKNKSMPKKTTDKFLFRTDKKVNPYQSKPEKSAEYQMFPVYDDVKSTTSSEQNQSTGLLTVNIKKHLEPTPRRKQINTSAKKVRQTPETKLEDSREISQFSPSDSRTIYGPRHKEDNLLPYHPYNNFQCRDCHGFYCHHCKSTIPPQYRPANMERQLDPKIVDFYKKKVYKGECQECEKDLK